MQVAVRVRPLLNHEKEQHWFVGKDNIHCQKKSFDFQIETEIKTQSIYNRLCRSYIKQAMQGFNCTILCYGQTTSGKTFTTLGLSDNPGILPCTLRDIFISGVQIWIQYIQIYNESVDDLIEGGNCKIIDDDQWGITVQGKKHAVSSFQEAIHLLNLGEERRIYRETQIHEHSSRSHTIFKIYLQNANSYSCINIVDLAGSEKLTDIDINKETGFINKSLLSLTVVINKLAENKSQHISYRDSKLTRLLSNSLGGNSLTLLICCVSLANQSQTQTTLSFAQRAKKVQNQVVQNLKENQDPQNPFIDIRFFRNRIDPSLENDNTKKLLQVETEFALNYQKLLSGYRGALEKLQQLPQLSSMIQQFLSITKLPEPCFDIKDIKLNTPITGKQEKQNITSVSNKEEIKKVINYDLQLLIWGSGQDGRLGFGDEKPYKIPTLLSGIKFNYISCGYHHTIGISNGLVYSWGRGQRGQLGHGDVSNQYQPKLITGLSCVTSVACGWQHSLAISKGDCYSWGYGEDGQLGDGHCEQRNIPALISEGATQVYCGHSSSAFMKNGSIFTFGNNFDGRCMIEYLGIVSIPEQVHVKDVKMASLGVSHMGVVCQDGSVYMAGTSIDGQLGMHHDDDEIATSLIQLSFFGPQNKAVQIACGDAFTLILNSQGKVYTFGKGSYKRLGRGIHNIYSPSLLAFAKEIKFITAGCRHASAIDKDDNLYMWGFNFHNQLGIGNNDQDQEIIDLSIKVKQISLGYFHSAALSI